MKLEQRLRKITRDERRRLIRIIKESLRNDDRVLFAYLHGSALYEGLIRDIDIAVWLRGGVDPLEYVIEKGVELERNLRLPVDIQVLNVAPVAFRYIVYTKGTPIIVNDAKTHDVEVIKTILMYIDFKMLRKSRR